MTRRLVLRGADGIVFVADSQWDRMKENVESLRNLDENLREYRTSLDEIPYVLQYNKRDFTMSPPWTTSSTFSTGGQARSVLRGGRHAWQGRFRRAEHRMSHGPGR